MTKLTYRLRKLSIILLHWEYWPFHIVYIPIYFYWIWLSIKSRSLFFFSASNPSIEYSGFTMESKKSIYDLLPVGYYPKTILVQAGSSLNEVQHLFQQQALQFPLVAKPDIGERGNGVQKVHNWNDVATYLSQSKVAFLLQEWCPYENEIGLFYCRYPQMSKGFISGIVSKEFFTIRGDGKKTVEALLVENDRYFLQLEAIKNAQIINLDTVLPKGASKVLVPYGNHCRGTLFRNYSFKIDAQLEEAMHQICTQIPGFYFGRLDIRFKDWELLKQGKELSIIELNGAGSEPTHIYDPQHSIFYAWKEIIKHLNILYTISKQNNLMQQIPYLSFKQGIQMFQKKQRYDKMSVQ